jgi:Lhr-like helicase
MNDIDRRLNDIERRLNVIGEEINEFAVKVENLGKHTKALMDNQDKHIKFKERTIESLIDNGYAVVLITPEELGKASPSKVEDRLIELSWDIIEVLND